MRLLFPCLIWILLAPQAFGTHGEGGIVVKDLDSLTRAYGGYPLYDQILARMRPLYLRAIEQQISHVAHGQDGFSLSGGAHPKKISQWGPFGNFQVYLSRHLEEDLLHEGRWIVNDRLTIEVDALGLLSSLEEEGLIEVVDLMAFAGVSFRRTYRAHHLASSYLEGLSQRADRLLFPFLSLRGEAPLRLRPQEVITREDSLSGALGGILTSPPFYGPVARAGVMAHYETFRRLQVKRSEDHLLVSRKESETFGGLAGGGIHMGFLGLLELTLFSFDSGFGLSRSEQVTLKFGPQDPRALMAIDGKVPQDLQGLVVGRDRRESLESHWKWATLTRGQKNQYRTSRSEIFVGEGGPKKTIYSHQYLKVDYNESLLGHLLGALLQRLIIWRITSYDYQVIRGVSLEYESPKNLRASREELTLETDRETLSISFSTKLMMARPQEREDQFLAFLLDNGTVEDGQDVDALQGPVRVSLKTVMRGMALDHLNALSWDEAKWAIGELCESRPKGWWEWLRNLFGRCRNKLRTSWKRYQKEVHLSGISQEYVRECRREAQDLWPLEKRRRFNQCLIERARRPWEEVGRKIPIWRLGQLLVDISQESRNRPLDFHHFFGVGNNFMAGKISSLQAPGPRAITYGKFQGMGLARDLVRQDILEVPPSIDLARALDWGP